MRRLGAQTPGAARQSADASLALALMRRPRYLITGLLYSGIAVLLCGTAQAQHQSDALRELQLRGIPFSDRSFVQVIKSGTLSEVDLFLKAGFDPNKRTQDGLPLGIACAGNRSDIAELLIVNGAGFGGQKGAALHAAASCGLQGLIERLLLEGADVNARATSGHTPLWLAVSFNHPEAAKTLLSSGADVEAAAEDGETPLIKAAAGRLQLVRLLLAHGAKVDVKNKTGHTALHVSVQHPAFIEISRLLISNGADVRAKTNDGWSNLHIALLGRNEEMARWFVDQGLDVKARTREGWTPLHLAAGAGYTKLVTHFIDRGADINAKMGGWTPLSFALDRRHLGTAAALVERGATQ